MSVAEERAVQRRVIRHFGESDIPGVARLHLKVFPEAPGETRRPSDAYVGYLRDVFLEGPHRGSGFHSLVCEEEGTIIGFLGVVPVRMRLRDQPLWATCCTQFGVDPERRGLTGLSMLRHHLAGPQDLTFSDECSEEVLKLWQWAGAHAVGLTSLYFMRPIRPGRLALSLARRRRSLEMLARLATPVAAVMDAALTSLPGSHFRRIAPPTRGDALEAEFMEEHLSSMMRDRPLQPLYEREKSALSWRLGRAGGFSRRGPLRRVLVRDATDAPIGWYLAYFPRGEVGEVLQVVAPPKRTGEVLEHLWHDAWSAGVVALSGRVDPAQLQAYSDAYCMFSRRGPWTIVHSRREEIVNLFHQGRIFVSRLEGEWCVRFE